LDEAELMRALLLGVAARLPIDMFLPNIALVAVAPIRLLAGRGPIEEKVDVLAERGAEISDIDAFA
jgi:hypothetical protein